MVNVGDTTLIGTSPDGTPIYGTVTYIHPKNRYLLTEREAPFGRTIRECVMMGPRRGQFANKIIGAWKE